VGRMMVAASVQWSCFAWVQWVGCSGLASLGCSGSAPSSPTAVGLLCCCSRRVQWVGCSGLASGGRRPLLSLGAVVLLQCSGLVKSRSCFHSCSTAVFMPQNLYAGVMINSLRISSSKSSGRILQCIDTLYFDFVSVKAAAFKDRAPGPGLGSSDLNSSEVGTSVPTSQSTRVGTKRDRSPAGPNPWKIGRCTAAKQGWDLSPYPLPYRPQQTSTHRY
jgi:hypothetical protein